MGHIKLRMPLADIVEMLLRALPPIMTGLLGIGVSIRTLSALLCHITDRAMMTGHYRQFTTEALAGHARRRYSFVFVIDRLQTGDTKIVLRRDMPMPHIRFSAMMPADDFYFSLLPRLPPPWAR